MPLADPEITTEQYAKRSWNTRPGVQCSTPREAPRHGTRWKAPGIRAAPSVLAVAAKEQEVQEMEGDNTTSSSNTAVAEQQGEVAAVQGKLELLMVIIY